MVKCVQLNCGIEKEKVSWSDQYKDCKCHQKPKNVITRSCTLVTITFMLCLCFFFLLLSPCIWFSFSVLVRFVSSWVDSLTLVQLHRSVYFLPILVTSTHTERNKEGRERRERSKAEARLTVGSYFTSLQQWNGKQEHQTQLHQSVRQWDRQATKWYSWCKCILASLSLSLPHSLENCPSVDPLYH